MIIQNISDLSCSETDTNSYQPTNNTFIVLQKPYPTNNTTNYRIFGQGLLPMPTREEELAKLFQCSFQNQCEGHPFHRNLFFFKGKKEKLLLHSSTKLL